MPSLSLSAQIEVSEKGIKSLALVVTKEPGFVWQVTGCKHCLRDIDRWMEEYSSGREPEISLPLDLDGLPSFTQQVLCELQKIPFGQTLSYRDVAVNLGIPRGARAVGNACGRNPMPLLIPCHRIVASGGSIGGFSLGLELKRHLLEFEAPLAAYPPV